MARTNIWGPTAERRGQTISWRVIVAEAGQKPRKKRFKSKALAQKWADAMKVVVGGEESLADVVERYRRYKQGNMRAISLQNNLPPIERFFSDHLSRPISAFSKRDAERCYQRLIDSGQAAATHRQALKLTRAFFKWATKCGYRQDNPCEGIQPQGIINAGKEQLRCDEARIWLAKTAELISNKDLGAMAASLTLLRGLRCSEIVNRTSRDLDNQGHTLWITKGKTRKSNRVIQVPLLLTRPLLERVQGLGPDERIFPRTPDWVSKMVKRICRLAGVREVCAHSMRGAYSSFSLLAGRGVEEIADSMGHTSPKITRRHYLGAGLEEQVRGVSVESLLMIPKPAKNSSPTFIN